MASCTQVGHTITIRGTVDYIRVAGELEFPPTYLLVYFDSFFKGSPERFVSADNASGVTQFSITGELPPGETRIPRDAHLMFQTYVTTVNDYGAACQEDTGMTGIEIFKMVASNKHAGTKVSAQLRSKNVAAGHDHIAVLTDEFEQCSSFKRSVHIQTTDEVKSTLHINVESITTTANGGSIAFNMQDCMNIDENLQLAANAIVQYNKSSMDNLSRYKVSVANTEGITCFWYPSNVTFAASAVPLMMPLPTFLMSQVPQSDPLWWKQQLEILADRQNFGSLETFCDRWSSNMSLPEKATYTMMLMSQYVNTLEYVSDRSNGKMIEMFGEAIAMRSGDCEDLAKAIYKMTQAFSSHGFENIAILREIYTISKQYVLLFCLEGVSATHTQNEKDFTDGIDGAHAATKAIPRDYFGECVKRGCASHPFAQFTVTDYYLGKLPVLVGEGTGMLFPVGKVDGHEVMRKIIGDNVEAVRYLKKTLYNTPTDSKFYKQIMLGVTVDHVDTFRTATLYFSTPVMDAKTGTPELDTVTKQPIMSKGVPFSLLVQRSPLVYFYPSGFAESVSMPNRVAVAMGVAPCTYKPEFTTTQYELMKSVVRTCVPPPVFSAVNTSVHGPVIDRDMTRIQNPVLDMLCSGLKNLKSDTMAAFQQKLNSPTNMLISPDVAKIGRDNPENLKTTINYYINPQYLKPQFATSFVAQMQKLNIAMDASYCLERHLDDYVMYRLTVDYLDSTFGQSTGTPPTKPPPAPSTTSSSTKNMVTGNAFLWH